jgi:hypothetical protein
LLDQVPDASPDLIQAIIYAVREIEDGDFTIQKIS